MTHPPLTLGMGGTMRVQSTYEQVMRTISHVLRGWPTPLGIAANTSTLGVDSAMPPELSANLQIMADQSVKAIER